MNRIILFFILLYHILLLQGCLLRDEAEDLAGGRIRVDEVKPKITYALLMAVKDCPAFHFSGGNPMLNWIVMLSSTPDCEKMEDAVKRPLGLYFACEEEGDPYTDQYNVDLCLSGIASLAEACASDPRDCQSDYGFVECEGFNVERSHLNAFILCSDAVNSTVVVPTLFF